MQVFKLFVRIFRKRLGTICVYVGIYAIFMMLFVSSGKEAIDSQFTMSRIDISVIDREHSVASEALTEYLGSMHRLIEVEDDETAIQDHIYYRYVRYILIIPEGFEEKLAAGERSGLLQNVQVPGSAQGIFIDNQVDTFIQELQIYLAGGYSMEDAVAAVQNAGNGEDAVEVLQFTEAKESGSDMAFHFFQYLPYIYILLLTCGLAPILFAMSKKDVYERTICSSVSLIKRNVQTALGCGFFSLLVYVIFILLGFAFCGKDMLRPELPYLLINSGVFLIFTLALTFLLCTAFTLNDSALNLVANIIGLGMCFTCGVFVPQELLAKEVLQVSRFLPAYWYIKNNNVLGGLTEEAFTVSGFWTAVGIQALFAAGMFAAALVASKLKEQKG